MIEDQSAIWQIAYILEPRFVVELLIQKKTIIREPPKQFLIQ